MSTTTHYTALDSIKANLRNTKEELDHVHGDESGYRAELERIEARATHLEQLIAEYEDIITKVEA